MAQPPHKTKDVKNSRDVQEVVVIGANQKKQNVKPNSEDKDTFPPKPIRRSRSDSVLERPEATEDMIATTGLVDWHRLSAHLRMKRQKSKAVEEISFINSVMKAKAERRQGKFAKLRIFRRKLGCLFTGPLFHRHRFRLIAVLEIVLPIFVFLFVTWSFTCGISWRKAYSERKAADEVARDRRKEFNIKPIGTKQLLEKVRKNFMDASQLIYIVYSPTNNFTDSLMARTMANIKVNAYYTGRIGLTKGYHSAFGANGVNDAGEVLEHCLLHRLDRKAHAAPIGIEFIESDMRTWEFPQNLKFTIRIFDETVSNTLDSHPYVQPPRKAGEWYPPYIESGFLGIQWAIQHSFLQMVYEKATQRQAEAIEVAKAKNDLMLIQKIMSSPLRPPDDPTFPVPVFKVIFSPNYFDKNIRLLISVTITIILCFSYTGLSFFIVRQIAIETHSGIKDFLSLHGMAKWQHWLIYFCNCLVFRAITAFGITLTIFSDYGEGPIFTHSTPFIIYGMIYLHLLSLSAFNILIGTIFSSVTFSAILCVSVCFFSFVIPYSVLKAGLLSPYENLIFALVFPNWALWNAIEEVVDLECDGVGVNWNNLLNFKSAKSQLSYVQCVCIFALGCSIYFLIAMMLDLTTTTEKRRTKSSWFHVFQKLIRRRRQGRLRRNSVAPQKILKSDKKTTEDEIYFEKPPVYEKPYILDSQLVKVRNVSKIFGQQNVLENINLDFTAGEIAIVLGQADSGKTTLLHCMAGTTKPTTGKIEINGIDVHKNIREGREYIGYCPEEPILFNILSAFEHLTLCYKLRGISSKDANEYSIKLLELMRLTQVKDMAPSGLTENEQRKLAIALCLVDRPSVLLLDEPTSGMDPLARHEVWHILRDLKYDGHAVIMTTNMMDEAEFLADRVIFLSNGKLICYGSPKYLRERYDTGYYLRITPNPAKFNLEIFQALPMRHFDETLKEAPEKTIFDLHNFLLILPATQVSHYADFFEELENMKESLGILAYGATTLTLSDIFIKMSESIGEDEGAEDIYIRRGSHGEAKSVIWDVIPTSGPTRLLKEDQFKVLTWKVLLFGKLCLNSTVFSEIIIPLLLIWLIVWHTRCFKIPPPIPVEREMTLGTFPMAMVYYRGLGVSNDELLWKSRIANYLGSKGEELEELGDMDNIIQTDTEKSLLTHEFSIEKRMIALEQHKSRYGINENELLAYYSSGSLHSPALVLSIVGNLLLQHSLGDMYDPPEIPFSFTVSNLPFPSEFGSKFDMDCGIACLTFAIVISFCIGFISLLYITFPVLERVSGFKVMQMMTGIHPLFYWLSYFTFQGLFGVTLTVGILMFFVSESSQIYSSLSTLCVLTIILTLFLSWSGPTWLYFLSVFFPIGITGGVLGFTAHALYALLPVMLMETIYVDGSDAWVIFMRYFFHIFPPYTLTSALYIFFDVVSKRHLCSSLPDVIKNICLLDRQHLETKEQYSKDKLEIYEFMVKNDKNLAKCCDRVCIPTDSCAHSISFFPNMFELANQPQLLHCISALVLQGFLFWGLLLIVEFGWVSNYWHNIILKFLNKYRPQNTKRQRELSELRTERELVDDIIGKGQCPPGTLLVCQNLTKSYTEHMVIDSVNFDVKEGDIVAMLGGTGCGKSVILKMLAGEVVPTFGSALIDKFDLHKDHREFIRRIGYCPQMDVLFDSLTGQQTLEIVGRLRGITANDASIQAGKWLKVLGLAEYAHQQCSTYSKSMRRQLCVSLALIGGLPVILLDEPMRSLDSISKQQLWTVLQVMSSRGHGFIFTSGNVNECEKYATKLVVLSEGNVQCLGSPDDLRHRFSRGFTLLFQLQFDILTPMEIVLTSTGRINDVKQAVIKEFRRAVLRDEQGNLLLFFLADSKLTWSQAFSSAEKLKLQFRNLIVGYLIAQATLDDVFVLLTNRYKNMDGPRNMRSSYAGEITQEEAEQRALEAATLGTANDDTTSGIDD